MNDLIGMIIPDINFGKEPDVKKLAESSGIDVQTIEDLIQRIKEMVKK
ncbi:MAG: hypothetical protein WD491_01090 [Balneolales bacterium]